MILIIINLYQKFDHVHKTNKTVLTIFQYTTKVLVKLIIKEFS